MNPITPQLVKQVDAVHHAQQCSALDQEMAQLKPRIYENVILLAVMFVSLAVVAFYVGVEVVTNNGLLYVAIAVVSYVMSAEHHVYRRLNLIVNRLLFRK